MSSSFFIGRSPAQSKGSSVPPDDIPLRDDRPVFNSRFDAPFALNGSPKPKNDHRGLESWARVYVNDAAFAVMKLESPVFPEGSIIVREKLPAADADAPELVTAMLKHGAGFSPKTNDWEFVVVDRNFTRLKQRQRSGSCFECHAGARQSDLVFKTYLR